MRARTSLVALDTTATRRARVEVLPVSATQHAGETVETRLMTVFRLAKRKSESRPQKISIDVCLI